MRGDKLIAPTHFILRPICLYPSLFFHAATLGATGGQPLTVSTCQLPLFLSSRATMVANEALAASLRASQVPQFKVMEVMIAAHERERAGLPVLHLEVGQPSEGVPAHACEASKRALDACAEGRTQLGYTLSCLLYTSPSPRDS